MKLIWRSIGMALVFACAIGLLRGSQSAALAPAEKSGVQVPILMYHHIATPDDPKNVRASRLAVPPAQLDEQLAYLQRSGYTTISLDDMEAALHGSAMLPAHPVILTFDDGYQDFYTAAYPLLQHYHDRATVYIVTGWVGKPGYMTWAELEELAASPLITIGAHTQTHPHLAKHSPARVRDELQGCKAALEGHLHVAVHHLAYPSGSYNKQVIALARASGYDTAVTVHYGIRERADKLLELPRVFVEGGAPLEELAAELLGQRHKDNPTGEG